MKLTPKFVFIVGFEKAATSTLANHLVEGYGCRYIVSDFKESALFRCAPQVMGELLSEHASSNSDETWIDATVDTVFDIGALMQIHELAGNYRVIICVRDQFERTVSAFNYYRHCNRRPVDDELLREFEQNLSISWVDQRTRLANGERPPRYLRTRFPQGNYAYSHLNHMNDEPHAAAELRRLYDKGVERFLKRSLEEQVLYEIYTYRTIGRWPALSVLGSSYYGDAIRRALTVLDPGRVMIVSSNKIVAGPELERNLTRFLGTGAVAHSRTVKMLNRGPRPDIESAAVARARAILSESFAADSQKVIDALARTPSVDTRLFAPEKLVWDQAGNLSEGRDLFEQQDLRSNG